MEARDIMNSPAVSVRPGTPVREAIPLLTKSGFAALPVVDELGRVIGIFSETDAVRAILTGPGSPEHQGEPVSTMLTQSVDVVGPTTKLSEIAERNLRDSPWCLPVVEAGLLIGVIARRDVLRTLIRDDDVIAAKVCALLDDYAGSRLCWPVTVDHGQVAIGGEFADNAERAVVTALARTVAGVAQVTIDPGDRISPTWDD